MKKHLLLAEFAAQLWAITPSRLSTMAGVLARWTVGASIDMVVRDQIDNDKQAAANRRDALPASGDVKVIPVYGIIAQRQVLDVSGPGMTGTDALSAQIRQAIDSPQIAKILLDIDSPGGSVYGIQELAAEIRQARQQKPVYAIANSLAASAAYWLGSQATQFSVTPGGEVGSIGVYSTHQYIGEALKKQGIETTLLSAGEFKTEGNPFEPLGEEARAYQQKRIDDYYLAFIDAVAQGRHVTADYVKESMGKGRVMGADDALALGMVDRIISFNDLVKELQTPGKPSRNRRAMAERELQLSAHD